MAIEFSNPKPLYQQVVTEIRSHISTGQLKPGDSVGSHHELVKEYNVSLITIKRALSDLISQGVLYSRVGKGTYVAEKKVDVDFGENKTIGLVLKNLENPFFSKILTGIDKRASESNVNLLLSSTSDQLGQEDKLIQHFLDLGVSGIIVASISHIYHPSSAIQNMHKNNYPYVVVSYLEDEEYNHIGVDHNKGGYIATEHLVKIGYRKIGYINSEKGNILGNVRKDGFMRALQNNNLSFNEKYVYQLPKLNGMTYYEYGYEVGRQFLTQRDRPEAIFSYNDLIALGFEKAFLEQGLSIPDDIAIIGYDNIKRGVIAQVPLSTVNQPTQKIGCEAVDFILKKLSGKAVKPRTILKSNIIVRDSCGAKIKKNVSSTANLL